MAQSQSEDSLLREFPSRSSPEEIHEVRYGRYGVRCTCKGFRFHGWCRHLEEVMDGRDLQTVLLSQLGVKESEPLK